MELPLRGDRLENGHISVEIGSNRVGIKPKWS